MTRDEIITALATTDGVGKAKKLAILGEIFGQLDDFRTALEDIRFAGKNSGTQTHIADQALNRADNQKYNYTQEGPVVMALCEAPHLILKPQTYRFVVMPGCAACAQAERDSKGDS
jgi:hypothetical protein